MTKKSKTSVLSNVPDQALAEAATELVSIQQEVAKADTHHEGYHSSLHSALANTYALTRRLVAQETLQIFVEQQGAKWTKTAEANSFQPVVALAFRNSQRASISKYATLLNYAGRLNIEESEVATWLKGRIEDLLKEARRADVTETEEYSETVEERLVRAIGILDNSKLGNSQKIAPHLVPELEDVHTATADIGEFRKALVRVVDGTIQIVHILPSSAAELKASILEVAPSESSHSARKLIAKPLYDIFRACDLFVRLNRDGEADSYDDEKRTYKVSTEEDGEIDFEAWEASIRDSTDRIKAKRFVLQRGLRLYHDGSAWHIESVSNELTFAGIRLKLASALDGIAPVGDYFLSARQARRIAAEFRLPGDWVIRTRGRKELGTDVAGERELVLDPFGSASWRTLNSDANRSPEFELTPHRAKSVLDWQPVYKAETGATLPKLIVLKINHETLHALASDRNDAKPSHGRLLGSQAVKGDAPTPEIKDRWIRRDDLMTLAALSAEYTVALSISFGQGNEGLVSLVAKAFGGEIHFPLAVSLAGDYAEISADR